LWISPSATTRNSCADLAEGATPGRLGTAASVSPTLAEIDVWRITLFTLLVSLFVSGRPCSLPNTESSAQTTVRRLFEPNFAWLRGVVCCKIVDGLHPLRGHAVLREN